MTKFSNEMGKRIEGYFSWIDPCFQVAPFKKAVFYL